MNVTLNPDLQSFVEEKVRSGQYSSPQDVILAGLAALKQQEGFGEFAPGELDSLIGLGEQSIRQGGTISSDQVADEIDRLSRRRRTGTP